MRRARIANPDDWDRYVVTTATSCLRSELADVAQYMWAKAYYPGKPHTERVLALIGGERADCLRWLLEQAAGGTTSDKAWYTSYGARAIRASN